MWFSWWNKKSDELNSTEEEPKINVNNSHKNKENKVLSTQNTRKLSIPSHPPLDGGLLFVDEEEIWLSNRPASPSADPFQNNSLPNSATASPLIEPFSPYVLEEAKSLSEDESCSPTNKSNQLLLDAVSPPSSSSTSFEESPSSSLITSNRDFVLMDNNNDPQPFSTPQVLSTHHHDSFNSNNNSNTTTHPTFLKSPLLPSLLSASNNSPLSRRPVNDASANSWETPVCRPGGNHLVVRTPELSSILSVLISRKELWLQDDQAQQCFLCDAKFSALRRRHHCRICGNVFDKKCSSKLLTVPGKGTPQRCCDQCFQFMAHTPEGEAAYVLGVRLKEARPMSRSPASSNESNIPNSNNFDKTSDNEKEDKNDSRLSEEERTNKNQQQNKTDINNNGSNLTKKMNESEGRNTEETGEPIPSKSGNNNTNISTSINKNSKTGGSRLGTSSSVAYQMSIENIKLDQKRNRVCSDAGYNAQLFINVLEAQLLDVPESIARLPNGDDLIEGFSCCIVVGKQRVETPIVQNSNNNSVNKNSNNNNGGRRSGINVLWKSGFFFDITRVDTELKFIIYSKLDIHKAQTIKDNGIMYYNPNSYLPGSSATTDPAHGGSNSNNSSYSAKNKIIIHSTTTLSVRYLESSSKSPGEMILNLYPTPVKSPSSSSGSSSSSVNNNIHTTANTKVIGKLRIKVDYNTIKERVKFEDFELIKVVGRGSFGKVIQVRKTDTSRIYAMKILKKETVISHDAIKHTLSERNVLRRLNHPFIVCLKYSFQTEKKLYLVLDYLCGGELFTHLSSVDRFDESRAKFYSAQIVLALGYLHDNKILYRDLKPENILLDMDGFIGLTDFGLCKEGVGNDDTTTTVCGSPEYLAPEIIREEPYGKAIDWWALGTFLYEMLSGWPPFYDEDPHVMRRKILTEPLTFNPYLFSKAAISLLTGLLTRSPERRLGSGKDGTKKIKEHDFFKDIDWDKMYAREVDVPFKPDVGVEGYNSTVQFDTTFTSEPVRDTPVDDPFILSATWQDQFKGFTWVAPNMMETETPARMKHRLSKRRSSDLGGESFQTFLASMADSGGSNNSNGSSNQSPRAESPLTGKNEDGEEADGLFKFDK